jgi:flagellar biosynthesis GTPase FlhF
MRPRHREISTLSLSMLDVIAGAMAAFLILVVILLPHYGKETVNQDALIAELRQVAAEAQAQREAAERAAQAAQALAAQAQAELASLKTQPSQTQTDLEAAETQLSQTKADLEAAKSQARQAQAEIERLKKLAEELAKQANLGIRPNLVLNIQWDTQDEVDLLLMTRKINESTWHNWEDNKSKPRRSVGKSAIWLLVQYPPGDLRIDVKLSSMTTTHQAVKVWGRVIHKEGSDEFREIQFSRFGQRESMATISVDGNGRVRVTP